MMPCQEASEPMYESVLMVVSDEIRNKNKTQEQPIKTLTSMLAVPVIISDQPSVTYVSAMPDVMLTMRTHKSIITSYITL